MFKHRRVVLEFEAGNSQHIEELYTIRYVSRFARREKWKFSQAAMLIYKSHVKQMAHVICI